MSVRLNTGRDGGMAQASSSDVTTIESLTDRYVIDGRASRFSVRAFATGMLSAMGHNPTIGILDFCGDVTFNPENLEAGSLKIVVKASSLKVQDDISAKDLREMERLMNQEVLETAKFPEIVYEAQTVGVAKMGDALYSASIPGQLTLHGVSRSQSLSARIALLGSMLRASGQFSVSQSDYRIKPVSVAGGALKLKDELIFSFEIVASKQE